MSNFSPPHFCYCKVVSCNGAADLNVLGVVTAASLMGAALWCCRSCAVPSSAPSSSGVTWPCQPQRTLGTPSWALCLLQLGSRGRLQSHCCSGNSEVLGSHSVLIKYTSIVAAVAAPQILDPRSGTGAVLNHLWVQGSRGGSRWVPAGLPRLARAGLGCDEEGLREILQLQFVLWLNRTSHSGRGSFVQGGRKHRVEEMR